jgi:hypothetical protein
MSSSTSSTRSLPPEKATLVSGNSDDDATSTPKTHDVWVQWFFADLWALECLTMAIAITCAGLYRHHGRPLRQTTPPYLTSFYQAQYGLINTRNRHEGIHAGASMHKSRPAQVALVQSPEEATPRLPALRYGMARSMEYTATP